MSTRPWPVAQYLDTHLGKVIRITRDGAPAPGKYPWPGCQFITLASSMRISESPAVAAVTKAKSTDTEKLIAAMEGMEFDTPKGKMVFRKEDHQALQVMYQWRMKANPPDNTDLLDLVREIPADEMKLPIKNKR